MTQIYISGQITGLPYNETYEKFEKAEELIRAIGLEPVNPMKNGLDPNESWANHMVADIKMLIHCDAILMLSDWVHSRGARIEKKIAEEAGMMIYFESEVQQKESSAITRLKDAIQSGTNGLKYDEYTTRSRQRSLYFARLIFVHHCIDTLKMDEMEVAEMIDRHKSAICKYRRNYISEIKYNPKFREQAARVKYFLTNNVSQ